MIRELEALPHLLTSPFFLLSVGFQLWMLVDACRRREWMWAVFIFFFSIISAALYFFLVYRNAPGSLVTSGFELPGTFRRQRVRELEEKIHNIDHAVHHLQLGDIYFHQGKLDKAEACYRAAYERDSKDIDIRAHLGQCLLRKGQPGEARPLLEAVCREDQRHDYGHTMMAYAETLAAVGDKPFAIQVWRRVLETHSYSRARVQLAQLLIDQGERDEARALLHELIEDDRHSPKFQRRRDKIWNKQAKQMLATLK